MWHDLLFDSDLTLPKHFKWNAAVLLRPSPAPLSKTGRIDKGKYYLILALVDPEQKERKRGGVSTSS